MFPLNSDVAPWALNTQQRWWPKPSETPASLAETASVDPAVFDYDDLVERCLGHFPLVEQLLATYEMEFWPQVECLEQALAAGDAQQVAEVAHQLKGASANISAVRLRELMHQIHEHSQAGNLEPIAEYLRQLHVEWQAFERDRAVAPRAFTQAKR